jgi:hypothetical protein
MSVTDSSWLPPNAPLTSQNGFGLLQYDTKDLTEGKGKFSDAKLARQVAKVIPRYFRSVSGKVWIQRQETRWAKVADGLAVDWVSDWAILQTKAAEESKRMADDKRTVADLWSPVLGKGRLTSITALCRARPGVLIASELLDANPDVMWAGGKPWDLRASATGPTRANLDPDTPHLHSARFAPSPGPTPLWDAYLKTVWPDEQIRAWALRVLSVALTGHSPKLVPLLYGEPDTGKSQVVGILTHLLGTYGRPVAPSLLGSNPESWEIATLRGVRLAFVDEGPRKTNAAMEAFKSLTGGIPLTGAPKYEADEEFSPTHTLVLTSNDEPKLTDPAVRSRMRLLPCDGDVAEVKAARRAIGHLDGRAWAVEAPGVLAAMMRETAAYLADPESVAHDRAPLEIQGKAEEIARTQDAGIEFIETCVQWVPEQPPETWAGSAELWRTFDGWANTKPRHSNNKHGYSQDKLAKLIAKEAKARGLRQDRISGRGPRLWPVRAQLATVAWSVPDQPQAYPAQPYQPPAYPPPQQPMVPPQYQPPTTYPGQPPYLPPPPSFPPPEQPRGYA